MGTKYSRYTEEELEFIRQHSGSMSDKAIGLKLNRNWRGIETQRLKMKYKSHPDHQKSSTNNRYELRTKAYAYELYRQGYSFQKIGLTIGVSAVSVYRWVNLFLPYLTGNKCVIVMQSKINADAPFF